MTLKLASQMFIVSIPLMWLIILTITTLVTNRTWFGKE